MHDACMQGTLIDPIAAGTTVFQNTSPAHLLVLAALALLIAGAVGLAIWAARATIRRLRRRSAAGDRSAS
jgi:hypothetical protein